MPKSISKQIMECLWWRYVMPQGVYSAINVYQSPVEPTPPGRATVIGMDPTDQTGDRPC